MRERLVALRAFALKSQVPRSTKAILPLTPDMAARDITFARKTTTIDGFLTRYWAWGQRERLNSIDPQEQQYQTCYPGQAPMICPDGSTVTSSPGRSTPLATWPA